MVASLDIDEKGGYKERRKEAIKVESRGGFTQPLKRLSSVSSIFCFFFFFFSVKICSSACCSEDKVEGKDIRQHSLSTNCCGGLRNRLAAVKAQGMPLPVCSKMMLLTPSVYSHCCSHPRRKNKINAFVIYSLCQGQSSRLIVGLWLPASLPAPAGARHPELLPLHTAPWGSE